MSYFINDEVMIDFQVSKTMQEMFDLAEKYDREKNHAYYQVADMIDVMAKNAYANSSITREQWDIIVNRYEI